MRALFVVVAIAAAAVPAHADVAARQRAGRAVFDMQVRALNDGKLDAFAKQFVDSKRAAAMFPSSRAPAIGRTEIRKAADEWAGTGRAPTAVTVVGTPIASVKADDDTGKRSERLVVVTGDLEVTVKDKPKIALRMTSVLSKGFDKANANALTVIAVFITEAVEDKALRTEDVADENKDIDRFLDLLRFPDVLAGHFDAGPDDIVLGSSAKERGTGADAKTLLGRWKDHKIVVTRKPHVVKELDWMYIMGTVSTSRGKKSAPMNVLFVGYPECGKTCVGVELTPHAVALHLGQAH